MDCKFGRFSPFFDRDSFSPMLDQFETGYLIKVDILTLFMSLQLSIEQLIPPSGNTVNKFLVSHKSVDP